MTAIKNWYQQRFNRWLDRRIPASREFVLQQRNVFIFPSRFGFTYLLLCMGLFVLGSNYQNNLMVLLCYFLLALFLIHLVGCYLNFSGLQIQLGRITPVFSGEQVPMPLWLDAGKRHGKLFLRYIDQTEQICVDMDNLTNPVQVNFATDKRGIISPPRVTISSFYPLGLFRCWTHLAMDCQFVVYPTPIPCSMRLYANDKEDQQYSGNNPQPGQNDFDRLRPYQSGESLNHIAWKQVAQGRGTFTKLFSSESTEEQWLKLASLPSAELETRLGQLSYMVIELTRQGQTFGLQLGEVCIQPNSGSAHQQACLTALARY
ncbi:DUF58 domain-containing protein [Neptunicella sp. SCSIO 80796]|uniref:DUF58 domain-containing protein n=1 Tax=Neptunicella plasticusilytica TaxID=3117012 RepID=UPI003A4E13D3